MLLARGHKVNWISTLNQVERLHTFKIPAREDSIVNVMGLSDLSLHIIKNNQPRYSQWRQQIDYLQKLILAEQPDLILFDRLLACGAMAAEGLGIPYVGVGTPGGHWCLKENGIHPSHGPVENYCQLGEVISRDMGWSDVSLNSFWVNSPLMNISFVGKDFYQNPPEISCVSVRQFEDRPTCRSGSRFGISFGNQGNEAVLKSFVENLLGHNWVHEPLDIFVGNNMQLLHELQLKHQSERIQFHTWVDFSKHFRELKCLAFFGGIGTIWHCIDNCLPMLVLPGMVGDQLYNGRIVSERALGECYIDDLTRSPTPPAILAEFNDLTHYQENISAFRSMDNYSDTMESLCDKLENV